MNKDSHTDEELQQMFGMRNIAVVGMSRNEEKAAHYVPKYLIDQGYNIIPVNPATAAILQRKSFPAVSSVPGPVEIVDVFRPSEDVLEVVKDVVTKQGIKVIWMQEGIYSEEAERIAIEKGIKVVYNRCMMIEHMRLLGTAN